MRFIRATLLALVAALAIGCDKAEPIGGETPKHSNKNVISLSPSTTEFIGQYALNPTILKGRTQACNYPPNMLNVPAVCSVKPDYERIASMKPDLIVYDAALFSPSDIDKLKQAAPGATILEFKANSIDEYIDSAYRLGVAVESASRFSEYLDKVYAKSRVGRSNPPDPKPKFAVILAGGGEYMVAGTEGFLADAIRSAGAEPVGPKSTKFETMPVEALIEANPDLIVVADDASPILKDPRLASIRAIKDKAVEVLKGDVLLRAGVRVDKMIEKFTALANARSDAMAPQ